MMGFLDRLNQGFANSGRPDQVRPPQGFLDSLSAQMGQGAGQPMGQPMQLAQPGMAPQEARVGQSRAPQQGGGFLDNLHNSISSNRGMLMGLGQGLMDEGMSGAGRAMGGMEHDEARRAREQQEQQAEAQRQAQLQLGQQHGIDPLMFEAGMGEQALSQAMRPAERFSVLPAEQSAQMGLPENGRFQVGPDGRVHQIGGASTTINNNMGNGTGVGAEEFIKNSVDQATAEIDAGNMAARTSVQLDELERLFQTAPQGMEGALTSFANGLGISVEGGDEVAAAEAIINQMVPAQRPPGSGPMSDADLALFKRSLVRIINQPGGNQIILQGMRALNQYDQARGQIAAQYQQNTVSGMREDQALQLYRQQMDELNASTPSLQSLTQGAPSSGVAVPTGIDPGDWEYMTPEQRALFPGGG